MTLGCRPGRSHCRALTTSTRANLPHLLHSFISRFISNSNFKSHSILLTSFQSYEDGVFDARDIPEELDRVLGKRLAFKFKVVPGNTCHSVSQLSNDDDLINFVLSKLPTLQHQQCLSATAESDPTLLGSITPAKRIFPLSHSQLDGIPFEDLSSIQLSSTRLGKKHIKTELSP
ncbi:hypothetical protein JHK87_055882 [Glycine soja]|nr:hypothetical protein JHK87_055882 [Glycine soja]